MSVYSNNTITDEGLSSVMKRLQAAPDAHAGWKLTRNGRWIFIEMGTDDLPGMPEKMLQDAARVLGDWPQSRISLQFDDSNPDRFEFKMARAVARAMAEIWNVALDNHAGLVEKVLPPGSAPPKLNS
jgi:hypothetical protein